MTLGERQQTMLQELVARGGSWSPACDWKIISTFETVRILMSLYKRNLVRTAADQRVPGTFEITRQGRYALRRSLKNAT